MKILPIFTVAIMLLSPNKLISQPINGYGAKIALTQSTIIPQEEAFNTTWRMGINFAFFIEKNIYKNLNAYLQLEYSQKGYKLESIETNETGERVQVVHANTRLDYLSIPVLLQARVDKFKIKPFIQAGPRLDYFINYKKGVYKFSQIQAVDEMPSYLERYSFSWGRCISIGCSIPLKSRKIIIIEVRNNADFTDLPARKNTFFGKNISNDLWFGFSF